MCFKPLTCWVSKYVNDSGLRSMVFNRKDALQPDDPQEVPCGKCKACRLRTSRDWAVRASHEAQLHPVSHFVTLTFDDVALAARDNPLSLDVRDVQKFMKRVRRKFGKCRVIYCGEYGEDNMRPHYHLLIFGLNLPDKRLWKQNVHGDNLYLSEELDSCWTDPETRRKRGFVVVGDVSFQSAGYVARYIFKKQSGEPEFERYYGVDASTGEVAQIRDKEFLYCSTRPPIARVWFDKYWTDVFPKDYCVIDGKKFAPPKQYLQWLEEYDSDLVREIQRKRKQFGIDTQLDTTYERLLVRETVLRRKIEKLVRTI